MIFMITFGIIIRNSHIVPPLYLGTFYSGLGLSLFLAAVCFIYSFIVYNKAIENDLTTEPNCPKVEKNEIAQEILNEEPEHNDRED